MKTIIILLLLSTILLSGCDTCNSGIYAANMTDKYISLNKVDKYGFQFYNTNTTMTMTNLYSKDITIKMYCEYRGDMLRGIKTLNPGETFIVSDACMTSKYVITVDNVDKEMFYVPAVQCVK